MKTHHYLKLGLLWLALCSFGHSYATDYVWVGTTNAWATGSNWSPAAPAGGPTASDNVFINTVVAPKIAPVITASTTIRSLTITSGSLNIGTNMTLTVTGNTTVAGTASKLLGSGKLVVGSPSVRAGLLTIGDGVSVTTVDQNLTGYCDKIVFTKVTFKTVAIESDELGITDCTFTGFVTVIKTGSTTDAVNGAVAFGTTTTFTNQGTGSLLFGNSDLDNMNFVGATTFTNNGSGSILFGNTDNDVFTFRNNVTFTKNSTGSIEVARYGNSDCYRDVFYNAAATDDIVFGNVGGGNWTVKGTVVQRLNGTAKLLKFNKLTMDKDAPYVGGLALYIPITLVPMPGAASPNPRLTLLDGVIGTTVARVTIPDDTEIVLGPDPSKSHIAGPLAKVGVSPFTFPIGIGGFYQPIAISAPTPSASNTIIAEYSYEGVPGASALATDIVNVTSCGYWTLTRAEGTSNVVATLFLDAVGCESVQLTGLKFCRYNTTTKRWETVAATQDNAAHTLTTNAPLPAFGYLTFGNSVRRIFVDTRTLNPAQFTISGAQIPEGVTYTAGSVSLGKSNVPLLPIPPTTGTSPILISIAEGPENEAMKVTFDIDNTSSISNVKVSIDNTSTFVPLSPDFYKIDNTPAVNGKSLTFINGDEVIAPLFSTNLTDGMVMMNSTGATFQIIGAQTYTITSFTIFSADGTLVKGPSATYIWDGTDQNGQEVINGVYKFELILSNNGSSYTYNGQVIVK
jgi:hypothetical protein